MRTNVTVGLTGSRTEDPRPEQIPIADYGWRPEVGDSRSFYPAALIMEHSGTMIGSLRPELLTKVSGTVVYINEAHRWCRVRYTAGDGSIQHECFKF